MTTTTAAKPAATWARTYAQQAFAQTIGVYERTAGDYTARWDDYLAPDLEAFADAHQPGAAILDAGCGPGRDLTALSRLGLRPTGVDTSPAMCAIARRSGQPVICADLRHLALQTGRFDGVWASASLVHLDYGGATGALGELAAVSKTGARGYATVRASSHRGLVTTGWEGDGEDRRWYRYWTAGTFTRACTSSGWFVDDIRVEDDSRRDDVRWVKAWLTCWT